MGLQPTSNPDPLSNTSSPSESTNRLALHRTLLARSKTLNFPSLPRDGQRYSPLLRDTVRVVRHNRLMSQAAGYELSAGLDTNSSQQNLSAQVASPGREAGQKHDRLSGLSDLEVICPRRRKSEGEPVVHAPEAGYTEWMTDSEEWDGEFIDTKRDLERKSKRKGLKKISKMVVAKIKDLGKRPPPPGGP